MSIQCTSASIDWVGPDYFKTLGTPLVAGRVFTEQDGRVNNAVIVNEKLADPDNFLALQLYDAMQADDRLVVQFQPDDERILEGEQGRARRVVRAWFANR